MRAQSRNAEARKRLRSLWASLRAAAWNERARRRPAWVHPRLAMWAQSRWHQAACLGYANLGKSVLEVSGFPCSLLGAFYKIVARVKGLQPAAECDRYTRTLLLRLKNLIGLLFGSAVSTPRHRREAVIAQGAQPLTQKGSLCSPSKTHQLSLSASLSLSLCCPLSQHTNLYTLQRSRASLLSSGHPFPHDTCSPKSRTPATHARTLPLLLIFLSSRTLWVGVTATPRRRRSPLR